jgi:hypothetical protein
MAEQAADNSTGAPPGFRIGTVFNRSFSVYGRNFLPFFAVCAIITSPSLYFAMDTAASTATESTAGALRVTPVAFDSAFWLMAIGITNYGRAIG